MTITYQPAPATKTLEQRATTNPGAVSLPIDASSVDLVLLNTSAGKDSQAMIDAVTKGLEADGFAGLVVAVHADLGRVEWDGTAELAEEQANAYGLRFIKCGRDGDLLDQIEERFDNLQARAASMDAAADALETGTDWDEAFAGMTAKAQARAKRKKAATADDLRALAAADRDNPIWPDSGSRYCTSDQKRAPIDKVITALTNEIRKANGGRRVRIVNAMGLRAEESPARAKLVEWAASERRSNTKREVFDWLPIHDWTEGQVWACIRDSGVAYHPAYDLGMPRLSCVFCVFAPKAKLVIAGRHNRALLDEYVALERKIGKTFRKGFAIESVAQAIDQGADLGDEDVTDWSM